MDPVNITYAVGNPGGPGTPTGPNEGVSPVTLYLIIAGVGFAILLMSVLFDGILDFLDFDTPFLSGSAIGAFLGGYGLTGLLLPDAWGVGAYLAALVPALALGALAAMLTRSLHRSESSGSVTADKVLGAVGQVVNPIRDGRYGEVTVSVMGQLVKYNAKSTEDLEPGTQIYVAASLSPSAVIVERY